MKESGTPASTVARSVVSGARSTSVARQANGTFTEGGIDEQTREIRAAKLTTRDGGDAEPVDATGSGEPARHAAGTSGPDPARSADRQHHRRWCLWHAQVPRAPSPLAAQLRSLRPARTPSPASPTAPQRSRATGPCAHHDASVEPSGDDGAAITAKAASNQRCIVSNGSASDCPASDWPQTTGRKRLAANVWPQTSGRKEL